MPKKNKEKKDKKQRKNSSSFFSNLNTDSTIEYGYAEKNPKSKWAKWTIAGLVGAATVTGIAVPWALSSCTVSLTKPYSNSEIMYTYIDPITKQEIAVSYGEFSERVNSIQATSTIFDQWDDVFYESVLESLYNEERDSFLKFKAIYEKLHGEKPTISNFGADLSSSFNDIEKEQWKILNDNKKSFEKATNKNQSWLDLWIKELQTNSIYGPQKAQEGSRNVEALEKKAVAYMVTQQIKSSALARFKGASITTSNWNYKDYQFANNEPTSNEIYCSYKNNKGEEIQITKSQAQQVWRAYLTPNQNAVLPKNIEPNVNDTKVAVFETKSYSVDYRNPLANDSLINLIGSNFNLGLTSSFTLSGLAAGGSPESPFSISSDFIKNLFKVQNQNEYDQTSNFIAISQLSKFKGANCVSTSTDENDSNVVQNNKDNLLLKTFNSDAKDDLATSKIAEISSMLAASDSSSSSTQSDDSSSSSSSINMLTLSALTSSLTGATSLDSTELFSINTTNPFDIFMKIIFALGKAGDQNNTIDLSVAPAYVQQNWNTLEYGSLEASSNLKQLAVFLTQYIDSSTYEFIGTQNASYYDNQLTTYADKLGDDDFTLLGLIMNSILIGDFSQIKQDYTNNQISANQIGFWTLYQLSAPDASNDNIGTYLYVSPSEVKVFSKNFNVATLEDFRKYALNDLNLTANNSSSDSPTLIYDVSSIFSKLDNDNLIILNLLSDPNNVDAFKNAIQKYKDEEPAIEETTDQIYNDFYNTVKLEFTSSVVSGYSDYLTDVSSSLTTLIDQKRVYDFATFENSNGEDIVVFQTQTLYGSNSIAQGKDVIDELFMNALQKLLTPKSLATSKQKGGNK